MLIHSKLYSEVVGRSDVCSEHRLNGDKTDAAAVEDGCVSADSATVQGNYAAGVVDAAPEGGFDGSSPTSDGQVI